MTVTSRFYFPLPFPLFILLRCDPPRERREGGGKTAESLYIQLVEFTTFKAELKVSSFLSDDEIKFARKHCKSIEHAEAFREFWRKKKKKKGGEAFCEDFEVSRIDFRTKLEFYS